MNNKLINFKKERDFGDLFSDTFAFIGQEFKRMGTIILYYVVPFLILSAIASTIYSVKLQEAMSSMMGQSPNVANPFAFFSAMVDVAGFVFINLLLTLIATNMLLCVVYAYVKLYVQHVNEGFTINDVWREAMKNFGRFLLASILAGLLTMIGFGFCLIPGIYIGVSLSLLFAIMMFENESFSNAFNRSFKLIKSKWWFTFGVIIVTIIMIYILSILISIPSMAMGFKSMFFQMKHSHTPGTHFSTGFYITSAITNLISNLFSIIPIIITSFLYFSFVEEKEKPSLLEKIDQINENE